MKKMCAFLLLAFSMVGALSCKKSCDGRPADEIQHCSENEERIYCLNCFQSGGCVSPSTTQCSVTTGDGETFDCNDCDGNNGCFEFENQNITDFCNAP